MAVISEFGRGGAAWLRPLREEDTVRPTILSADKRLRVAQHVAGRHNLLEICRIAALEIGPHAASATMITMKVRCGSSDSWYTASCRNKLELSLEP